MNEFFQAFRDMFSFENVKWDVVWEATADTIYMTGIATFFTLIIGLVLGIILFLSDKSDNRGASRSTALRPFSSTCSEPYRSSF